jgi:hypothetical protein
MIMEGAWRSLPCEACFKGEALKQDDGKGLRVEIPWREHGEALKQDDDDDDGVIAGGARKPHKGSKVQCHGVDAMWLVQ